MNISELNGAAGAPASKPWLRPVVYSIETGSLSTRAINDTDGVALIDFSPGSVDVRAGTFTAVGGSVVTATELAGVVAAFNSHIARLEAENTALRARLAAVEASSSDVLRWAQTLSG